MIVDRIERWTVYQGISPYFKEAMEFALTLTEKTVGTYQCETLPEGIAFAMIQEGETGAYEDGRVEAHRKYMDVQIMLDGGETVFYTDIEGLNEIVPYVDDIVFYEKAGQPAKIEKGMFYAVFPHDGHMPCRKLEGCPSFRKIVLKIRVGE